MYFYFFVPLSLYDPFVKQEEEIASSTWGISRKDSYLIFCLLSIMNGSAHGDVNPILNEIWRRIVTVRDFFHRVSCKVSLACKLWNDELEEFVILKSLCSLSDVFWLCAQAWRDPSVDRRRDQFDLCPGVSDERGTQTWLPNISSLPCLQESNICLAAHRHLSIVSPSRNQPFPRLCHSWWSLRCEAIKKLSFSWSVFLFTRHLLSERCLVRHWPLVPPFRASVSFCNQICIYGS